MRWNPWKLSTLALAAALAFTFADNHVGEANAEPSRIEDGDKQPHMHAALEHLEAARTQLTQATTDKGGHRARANALVRDAIDQVKKGIAFDQKH